MHKDFQLRPVTSYQDPMYPGFLEQDTGKQQRDRIPLYKLIPISLLILLLSFGLIACFYDGRNDHFEQFGQLEKTDGGTDGPYMIDTGIFAVCSPEDLFCENTHQVKICVDEYRFETISCDLYCQIQTGTRSAYSAGCDDSRSSDICQCQVPDAALPWDAGYYTIDSGVSADITPRDVNRADVTILDNGHAYDARVDTDAGYYGIDGGVSDNTSPDDLYPDAGPHPIDTGISVECMPGDLVCEENGELGICSDYYYEYDYVDCDQYCRDSTGNPQSHSAGCDVSDEDDPCQCE